MNNNPLVSVITIFFNEEKFITEAITSLLAQTHENWELFLVDDGSTDASTVIAQQYAQQYPNQIYYLEHEGHQNRGMSSSRNLAINKAQGKYLAFLDADDVWLPHKLEQQVAILESHPQAALVCGRTQWWYSWTGNPEDSQRDFLQEFDLELDTLIEPPQILLLFLQNEWASLCDILVQRKIVESVGGYEHSFTGMYEDQAFHTKLCLTYPVFVSSQCWYRYRQHPECCTIVSNRKGLYLSNRQIFLNWVENYLIKQGFKGTKIWQVLEKELSSVRNPRLAYYLGLIKQRTGLLKLIAKRILPTPIHKYLANQWYSFQFNPPIGWVNFGNLRRLTPISQEFGFERGLPIDRYYVEKFLSAQASAIQGRVLEIGDNIYTKKFGGDQASPAARGDRVTKSDILHLKEGNPQATFVGDLTKADHLPSDTFDCVILAQTLHLIYDFKAALRTIHRILKSGGVLLATFPGISQKSNDEWGDYWCWSFTSTSTRRMFEETFPQGNIEINVYGNVLAAIAFLEGIATQELKTEELDYHDPNYELLITVKAVKRRQKFEGNPPIIPPRG